MEETELNQLIANELSIEHLKKEYSELEKRFNKSERIFRDGFDSAAKLLGSEQAALLMSQQYTMNCYLSILESRIFDLEYRHINK